MDKKPKWLRKKVSLNSKNINEVKNLLNSSNLHTVCQSAKCPNIFECFSKKTATFMLMGDICTRNCAFCSVKSGNPESLDREEPGKIAEAVKKMGLKYIVLTSVTRDDLDDGGARHFASTVTEIKKVIPESKIECLIPDFKGKIENLKIFLRCDVDVLNHNLETIKRNYPSVRKNANYEVSLNILKRAKEIEPKIITKSGFMLGLGEKRNEIIKLLSDIDGANCDILTIGQYLRPAAGNIPVKKYYTPEEFDEIKATAKSFKFKEVVSGIFVRSSYHAAETLEKIKVGI